MPLVQPNDPGLLARMNAQYGTPTLPGDPGWGNPTMFTNKSGGQQVDTPDNRALDQSLTTRDKSFETSWLHDWWPVLVAAGIATGGVALPALMGGGSAAGAGATGAAAAAGEAAPAGLAAASTTPLLVGGEVGPELAGTAAATTAAGGGMGGLGSWLAHNWKDVADVAGGAMGSIDKSNQNNRQLDIEQQNSQLARDKFASTLPQTRLKSMLMAILAQNAKPSSVSWGGPGSGLRGEVPTFSGGASSLFNGMQGSGDLQGFLNSMMHENLMGQLNNPSGTNIQ